ncbi:zinc knuckle protein [Lasius niger]|uniref:Zinc knuckle protein n=1 Tax=Lasius niger TaxID=67767 RepID=A0A0J7KMF3_LASNI|nr:zinc knuckle protein [Lasius niger]
METVELVLEHHEVLEVVTGELKKPVAVDPVTSETQTVYNAEMKEFKKKDTTARLIIIKGLNDANLQLVNTCTNASEIWEKLLAIYEQSSGQRLDRLLVGYGTVIVEMLIDGTWKTNHLKVVWHVPDLVRNLFSVTSTLQKGFKFIGDSKECQIIKDNKIYIVGQTINKLYGLLMRKWDRKGQKGIFVGYCDEKDGYQIWIRDKDTVIRSRDVIFKSKIFLKSTSELKLKTNSVESTVEAKVDEEIDVKEDATSRELEEASCSSGHQSEELQRKLETAVDAPDLQIYLHCEPSNLQNGILKVNEDIKSIVHWAGRNGLTLNSAKTQAIIFGTARYLNAIKLDRLSEIVINGSAIQLSTSVKYLGVTISNTLSWNVHVNNVVKNTHKTIPVKTIQASVT